MQEAEMDDHTRLDQRETTECALAETPEDDLGLRCAKLEELRGRATCSVEAAAELLGVGRSTAYAAVKDGSLPTVRISHRLLVPTTKLLTLLGYDDGDRRSD